MPSPKPALCAMICALEGGVNRAGRCFGLYARSCFGAQQMLEKFPPKNLTNSAQCAIILAVKKPECQIIDHNDGFFT